MTVFKTFLKILNKNKFIVILYTVILLIFSAVNMQTSENNMSFVASKPDVMIVNYDNNDGITKDLIRYMKNNSNIIDLGDDEEEINDGLFYREVNYIIYIPENFNNDFMNGDDPEIQVKSTGDYASSLAEMFVSRYINVAKIYRNIINDEDELISKINETLSKQTVVEITSKLDTNALSDATYYFNFESYAILACLIYVICLILSIFNDEKIRKRTVISSTNYKKNNRILLLSNCLYSFVVWLFYLFLSFIFVGDIMFSVHGFLYALNSLIFTMSAVSIAFFLGNLVQSKNAISGIVNVIALGSSFLCGAFIPMMWLPDYVLKIAHILPTYYYIKTNDALTTLEVVNFDSLKPLLMNMGIILVFVIVFIILTNIVSNKKRKIG